MPVDGGMLADSPLVTRLAPSLGHVQGKYGPRREYGGIVVHVTGSGPLRRYLEGWRPDWAGLDADSTLLDVACVVYQRIQQASAHYLVYGRDVVQLAPEAEAAWHVGAHGAGQYQREDWMSPELAWWGERHADVRSPLELADGRIWGEELSANAGSVGVEILWPSTEQRLTPSPDTYETLGRLLRDICERREIPRDPYHVVQHSDIHPVARTAHGQPWDAPPDVLTPARIAELLRVPAWCR